MKVTLTAIVAAGLVLTALLSAPGGQAEVRVEKPVVSDSMRSPGKMVAPISLRHRLGSQRVVGKPLVVELEFAARGPRRILLEIGAQPILGLDNVARRQVRSGEIVKLTLLPQQNGRHYLSLVARQHESGQARVFQVPVQIGSEKAVATAHKASRAADGELLVRLPAQ